ncbi:MAG TPA: DUF5985 family protein [Caulobacteraceae bacterium]|nr:DUF5985 family protein [Caulobacteraceae bacterium]
MSHYPEIASFIAGMVAFGFVAGALFLLQFYRETRDRLFLYFIAAFVLFAVNQAIPIAYHIDADDQAPIYLTRLAGYIVIIVGIAQKNLA